MGAAVRPVPLPGEAMASATARLRARQALSDAGLPSAGLERVSSNANEVWFVGDLVLRVCPSPDARRLTNEAAVVATLPATVPHARALATGRTPFGEWLVAERLPGTVLSRAWPSLHDAEREAAVHQVGAALRAIHAIPADPAAADPPPDSPHPLPADRLLRLLDRVADAPHVDPELVARARALVLRHRDALDPGPPTGLVHGDLHFENLLWHDGRLVAVLDFEWSRPGPADLDLDVLLRFCADPAAHVATDYRHAAVAEDYRSVPRWLRDAYPELFAHPRLNDRLAVYCLAYDVRHLLLHRPGAPEDELVVNHPLRRIRRLLEGRGHLPWMAW